MAGDLEATKRAAAVFSGVIPEDLLKKAVREAMEAQEQSRVMMQKSNGAIGAAFPLSSAHAK